MIVSLKEILKEAEINSYCLGSFSVNNMESVLGIIKAAEDLKSPVIIQIAEPRLKHAPLSMMAPLMVTAAKNAKIPVVVHFDHGTTEKKIYEAIDLGFSSVMIDASYLPFEENITLTKKIAEYAHNKGVSCEGEIGVLGISEDGQFNRKDIHTDCNEARIFSIQTKVDALAVAIGNQHGLHTDLPNLDFKKLNDIYKNVDTPLVLHGGSGITSDDFKRAIDNGIRKINIASTLLRQMSIAGEQYFTENNKSYFEFQDILVEKVYNKTKEFISIFGSDNKYKEEL